MTFDLDHYLAERRTIVDRALVRCLDELAGAPKTLVEAMRYSLLAGGKRLRPVLALAACEAVSASSEAATETACALEMIHTYSLIHDDLPAMDDDDFRRGRPTNHKVYGEAMAILAGDALLSEAFRCIARSPVGPEVVLQVVSEVAQAIGPAGMVGGQVIDIQATGHAMTIAALEELHRRKTGDLLAVSIRAGARLGGASPELLDRLDRYGRALGLAFQIIDDVLDVTADLATLGKDPGSDREAGKTTFVDLLGVDGARRRAREAMGEGISAIESLGERVQALIALGRYTVERDR